MAVITVARPLREKLGEEATDALVALINEANEDNKKSVIEFVEERFERRLAEEMGKIREEMSKMRVEMADLRANLVQWMFLFWIGQIGVLTGILFAFFRK
ncbi:MAG TPA: hypothetical protein VNN62_14335 [Methylomirabilota bacterium]|nr:hypothetical protein [Methylomirabilota bacterium]